MNSFYYDLILSGLTYVLLTYLTFTLMKRRKRPNDGNNDGGMAVESGPNIDLPPGIVWPDDPELHNLEKERTEELVL